MKNLLLGLIILGIGSQLLTSCSSSSNTLSQFSKRKYLKKHKNNKAIERDEIERKKIIADYPENLYATKEIQPEDYLKEEEVESNNQIIPQKNIIEEKNIKNVDFEKQLIELNSDSLEYNDTIITNSDEIIVCKITSEDDESISYHFNPGSGKKVRRFIPKSRVKYYSKKRDKTIPRKEKQMEPMATTTIVLIALAPITFGFSLVFTLITGIIALNKINKSPEKLKGKGWAIAGIIISVIVILLMIIMGVLMSDFGATS